MRETLTVKCKSPWFACFVYIVTLLVITAPISVFAESVAKPSKFMVATAHPLAVEAGLDILERGGSVADAAVAVQAVLSLVEPQSSGIGVEHLH